MGYMHIDNLYRPEAQKILLFKQCYALEKVHGTSAHISWKDRQIHLSPGGTSLQSFSELFYKELLAERFLSIGHDRVVVYGEAYGGKMQRMADTYGNKLCFIAFEVSVGGRWLSVPNAHAIADRLGLEFVPYKLIGTSLSEIDAERDAPSEVAVLRGISVPRPREGVVLRPTEEFVDANGDRIIAKHKRGDFRETRTPRPVSPEALKVLTGATEIADEWVTPMRLRHVTDKLGLELEITDTPKVIEAMIADVLREGAGEFVDSMDVRRAIGRKAAELFRAALKQSLAG